MVNFYSYYTYINNISHFFFNYSGVLGPIAITSVTQRMYQTQGGDPNQLTITSSATNYIPLLLNDIKNKEKFRFATNLFSSDFFLRVELLARSCKFYYMSYIHI